VQGGHRNSGRTWAETSAPIAGAVAPGVVTKELRAGAGGAPASAVPHAGQSSAVVQRAAV
jgi:hypothetical protein